MNNIFKKLFKIFRKDNVKLLNPPNEIIKENKEDIIIPEKVIAKNTTQIPSEGSIGNFRFDSDLLEVASEYKDKKNKVEDKRNKLKELDETIEVLTKAYGEILLDEKGMIENGENKNFYR